METNLDKMKKDLKKLIEESDLLHMSLISELVVLDEDKKRKLKELDVPDFKKGYEIWYTEAMQLIKQIVPDRLLDFVSVYKNDRRKDKEIDFLTYTISDYLIGVTVTRGNKVVVDGKSILPKFEQQQNILKAISQRFESTLFEIKQILQADIFDDELGAATELLKHGFYRAAGAIVGVVLEKHLKNVCVNHGLKSTKKNLCLGDCYEMLKTNDIIDVPTWRYIQHLSDIRNLCCHSKGDEPTKEQAQDFINGVDKVIKTVY